MRKRAKVSTHPIHFIPTPTRPSFLSTDFSVFSCLSQDPEEQIRGSCLGPPSLSPFCPLSLLPSVWITPQSGEGERAKVSIPSLRAPITGPHPSLPLRGQKGRTGAERWRKDRGVVGFSSWRLYYLGPLRERNPCSMFHLLPRVKEGDRVRAPKLSLNTNGRSSNKMKGK